MHMYIMPCLFVCACAVQEAVVVCASARPAADDLEGTSAPPLEVGLHVSGKLSASRVSGSGFRFGMHSQT